MSEKGFNEALVADTTPSLNKREIEKPVPGQNQVLVKISHIAQNPTDVQSFDSKAFGDGAVYGCDFVGEVVEIGEKVTRLAVGDVVAALVWGGEIKGIGGYSRFTLADEKICFKPPPSISQAQAATVPLAAATAWLALFSKGCLQMDRGQHKKVLIWGGSSSVGQYAIQLASLYSYEVITTCSPRNFDLVKDLGATLAIDYSSPDVVEQIKAAVPDLAYAFDTIGNTSSSETASRAMKAPAHLCTVRPGKANTDKVVKGVEVTDVLVWTAFLKDHSYGKFHWPASEDDHELSSELFGKLSELLGSGKVKANEVYLLHGLDSVPEGFEMYRTGKISAKKIV